MKVRKRLFLTLTAVLTVLCMLTGCAERQPALTTSPKTTAADLSHSESESGSALPSALRFDAPSVSLRAGESLPLAAHFEPAGAEGGQIRYVSADESVFVYQNGAVIARGEGAAMLTAMTEDGAFSASCFINVSSAEDPPSGSTPSADTSAPDGQTEPTPQTDPTVVSTVTPVDPTSEVPTDHVPTEPPTIPVSTEPPTTDVSTETQTFDPPSTEVPTDPPEKTLVASFSMLTAGDNLYHSSLLKDARERRREGVDEDFYFDSIYEAIRAQVTAADYAVINQESMILPKRIWRLLGKQTVEEMYYRNDGSFVAPDEVYDTLMRLGFDAFDMANNHALDMGAGGLQWSLDYLNGREGLLHFGAFYDEEDRARIRTAVINGVKVAFLAYTYGTNVSTEVAAKETGFRFLVPYIDDEKMIEELQKANEIADFTVVCVHWGTEYSFEPNELQRHTAKVLAENGAGIIIGHHSHTIQPIEYLDDGRGGKVLCAYSLGTLVSNMDTDRNMLAGLFSFRVNLFSDGSVEVTEPLFTPTVFYYAMNYRGNRLMYLNEMTPELAATHGIGNYPRGSSVKNTMTVPRLYEYLHNVIAEEFLPDEYK